MGMKRQQRTPVKAEQQQQKYLPVLMFVNSGQGTVIAYGFKTLKLKSGIDGMVPGVGKEGENPIFFPLVT